MATHWTACTPREHPTIERFPIYPNNKKEDDAEWDRLYKKAEEFVHTRNDVFNKSVRHQIVLGVLKKAFPVIDKTSYPPQSLPLGVTAPSKDNQYVTWTGCDTILGPALKLLKEDKPPALKLPKEDKPKIFRLYVSKYGYTCKFQ